MQTGYKNSFSARKVKTANKSKQAQKKSFGAIELKRANFRSQKAQKRCSVQKVQSQKKLKRT